LHSDPAFYYTNRCGVIDNVTVDELDVDNKIMMLSDERIICFDALTIT
jgi:hypothetical protein